MSTLKITLLVILFFGCLLGTHDSGLPTSLSSGSSPLRELPGSPAVPVAPDTKGVSVRGAPREGSLLNRGFVEWSQFRGEQGMPIAERFDVPVSWSDRRAIHWKSELPGRGASSPIISHGHVYVTSASGYGESVESPGQVDQLTHHVICLVRDTGKLLWQRDIKGTPLTQELNQQILKHGFASSTPVADNEMVYAFFGASGLFAFTVDGEFVWQADVGFQQHVFGSSSSLILHDDLLIVNASIESESVFALDKKTGKGIWKIDNVKHSWSTPVIGTSPAGNDELIVMEDGAVRGFDPLTGKQRWRCSSPSGNVISTPFIQHGVCFCNGGTQRRLLAIRLGGRGDVTDTHLMWNVAAGASVSSPLYLTGNVYLISDNGFFQCFDARTGERISRTRTPSRSRVYASPIFAGNHFYLPLENAGVVVCEANPEASLVHINRFESDDHSLKASLSTSANGLFLRNDAFLYCIVGSGRSRQVTPLPDKNATLETIFPTPRFDLDLTTGKIRPYNYFFADDRRSAYQAVLAPFQSVLTWKESEDLHELIDRHYDPFDGLHQRQRSAYWDDLQSGSDRNEKLATTLRAVEEEVNDQIEWVRNEIKKGLSSEQLAQLKSTTITTD